MDSVEIAQRYQGPTASGNGGYVAGRLAAALGGVVEVTLRAPPPLQKPLRLSRDEDRCALHDGEQLVAEARSAELSLQLPNQRPTHAEAVAASAHCFGFHDHAYPECFVCGPARAEGDGLRIFPGRDPAHPDAPVAAPFTPHASIAEGGAVLPEMVWAALDCPGYFGVARPAEPAVLGRMTAAIARLPEVGEPLVVLGFSLGREGRKLHAGSALLDADGAVIARSRQIWIAPR